MRAQRMHPSITRRLQHGAALCLMLLAAGCAGIAPPTSDTADSAPARERHYHEAIDLSGRLSAHYQQNGRNEAVHGSFTWRQSTGHITLSLSSPLGQTLAVIDIKPGLAVLTQSGQPQRSAADVDTLTEQALGWPLPVSGLSRWLQGFGRGVDGQPFVAQPARAPTGFVTHDGWTLMYGEWQENAAWPAQNLPKRLNLARETQQAGPVSIRIVIDHWQHR